jgi:RNA polymerase sigma-70 factor (ECF subfamily)
MSEMTSDKTQKERLERLQARVKARREARYLDEREADRRAIERCLKGDREAFSELVNRYQKPALHLAYRYVRHDDDALDLVQDAFLKAYKALERFELGSSFYAWLSKIVSNSCIDHLRKQKKRRGVEYEDTYHRRDADPERALSADMSDAHPATAYETRELQEVINTALMTLSDKHREVIILRELEQLSYEEIAQATSAHIGTVMSRLHHARKKLQEALRPYYESIGDEHLVSLIGEGVGTKRKVKPSNTEGAQGEHTDAHLNETPQRDS